MIKASDFRAVFGKVTQHAPAYRHSKIAKNESIAGPNAGILKFKPSLCSHCNNARTQPFDKAWERLSEAIRVRDRPLRQNDRIPLDEIFGENSADAMLNVHLYFLKLLGCQAVEYKIPLPLVQFSQYILSTLAHPHLFLGFVAISKPDRSGDVIVGDIQALDIGGQSVSASWFYIVGCLGVHISYVEPGRPRLCNYRGWHPDDLGKVIRLR